MSKIDMTPMLSTLGDKNWVMKNEANIKKIFPETWTHINNLNVVQIGFQIKLLGIDWRSDEQYSLIMGILSKMKLILRDGHTIRSNPYSIFNKERQNE